AQRNPRRSRSRRESRPEAALRECPGGYHRPVPAHERRYGILEKIAGGEVSRARRTQRRGGGVFELRGGGALPTRIPALQSRQDTTLPWSWASTSMYFRHFGHWTANTLIAIRPRITRIGTKESNEFTPIRVIRGSFY